MDFINRFARTDFASYEDFMQSFELSIPESFNFGYDVVDAIAATHLLTKKGYCVSLHERRH